MSEFGKYLKEVRRKKKISQRELAKHVGVDFTYISKIENGVMPAPSEETIKKMASVLGEDADKMVLMAEKIPSEIRNIIYQHEEIPVFLRKAQSLTKEQWDEINTIVAEPERKYDDTK